jgi:hypothetical protein
VPTARPQIPVETLRRSKWLRNFLPFGVGGHAVFVGGPHGSPSGQERQVCLDGLVGVDSFLAHGDVDVAVTGDHLGDMRARS